MYCFADRHVDATRVVPSICDWVETRFPIICFCFSSVGVLYHLCSLILFHFDLSYFVIIDLLWFLRLGHVQDEDACHLMIDIPFSLFSGFAFCLFLLHGFLGMCGGKKRASEISAVFVH